VKKVYKKVLIEIVLVEESCEISNKQIEKDIRKEAFIPWSESIIKVVVSGR
jgi:hypothetical protein